MTKRLCATGLLALVLFVGAVPAAHAVPRRASTVVLLLAPYLTWDDVMSGYMPETARFAQDAAAANMNVRSLLPDAGEPSAEAGALMLSAGTWARHDASAGAPVDATGTPAARFPGLAVERRANAAEDADIRLGTLGQAVVAARGVTAAIGNGDGGGQQTRPAALAAMDARGDVALGDVSTRMLRRTTSSDAAFGVLSDASAIRAELADVLRSAAAAGGPTLVVIDPGDLERAHRAAPGAPDDLKRLDRVGALRALDALVGSIRPSLPDGTVFVLAAPVAGTRAEGVPGFGPLLVSDGGAGLLTSTSTHRRGLVTSADLTAGILDTLGVSVPVQVAGSPVRAQADTSQARERMLGLAHVDAFMRAVDGVRGTIVNAFILVVTVVLAVCLAVARPSRLPAAFARYGQLALLALAAVPVSSLLMFLPSALPQTQGMVAALLLGTVAVVLALDVATHHTERRPRALSALALLSAAVVLADQWLGAPLSLDGLFSYSPLVGARYYGIGNEMAALLVGGVLTGFGLLFDTYAVDYRRLPSFKQAGIPLVGAACVVTAAAPFFGANIGVAVWGVFAFALAWWGMLGRKVTWRTVLAVLLAIVLLVGAFAAVDLLGIGPRTHLGRSLVSATQGGPGQLVTIVARKAATNARILFSTSWSFLFIALAGALAYVRLRPRGAFRDILVERPSLASVLTAIMIAGVIAYFTEDSGIVVPALLLFFPTVAVVYMMLSRRVNGGESG